MPCKICGQKSVPYSVYCARCRKFINVPRERAARAAALKAAWRPEKNAFVCAYSGVAVEELDTKSPWYLTFDHRTPQKKGDLAVTAALFNSMKSDLTDREFFAVVRALAAHLDDGTEIDKSKIAPGLWHRAIRPVKKTKTGKNVAAEK